MAHVEPGPDICHFLFTLVDRLAAPFSDFPSFGVRALYRFLLATTSLPGSGHASVPDPFQTAPGYFAGPTKTGLAPFLAATDPVPFGTQGSFIPNGPLETALPVAGGANDTNIFHLMGQLSPYFPNEVGFGVNEYPLPPGTNISQVHLIHRHGSRYPESGSSSAIFTSKIQNLTRNGNVTFTGALSPLNTLTYDLGTETLVPQGRQELFDSGVLFYYNYGRLYDTSSKIVARTTTQYRMFQSAQYFMAGFFGLEWARNVSLEAIIEGAGSNNSLYGALRCDNANIYDEQYMPGNAASLTWRDRYLAEVTDRFDSLVRGDYTWTTADSYHLQTLCPYETVALGYSQFCGLFTLEEWRGYEYSIDLSFHGNNGFGSPTGRAVGIGYVEEVHARLQHHVYDLPAGATQVNTTLDGDEHTFPLDQSLYFDFSHDTNIMSVITAFGLQQFNQSLSPSGPQYNHHHHHHQAVVSHLTPFAARFVIEVIRAPYPVKARRPTGPSSSHSTTPTHHDPDVEIAASHNHYYHLPDSSTDATTTTTETTYIHILISQRTIPLHASYPDHCPPRDDGWCELAGFLALLDTLLARARYEEACFGG